MLKTDLIYSFISLVNRLFVVIMTPCYALAYINREGKGGMLPVRTCTKYLTYVHLFLSKSCVNILFNMPQSVHLKTRMEYKET